HYLAAFDLAINSDMQDRVLFDWSDVVSHEAATGYIRLADICKPRDGGEEKTLIRVKDGLKRLKESINGFAITPIVFSLRPASGLADLLAEARSAEFDLDGNGVIERWPWVKPTTGILVWDPDGTGKITSGRQLFGSVTWWLFFEDGYHAL